MNILWHTLWTYNTNCILHPVHNDSRPLCTTSIAFCTERSQPLWCWTTWLFAHTVRVLYGVGNSCARPSLP